MTVRPEHARAEARENFWGEYDRGTYRCPECGSQTALEVHHRDGDPFNNAMGNLVALCHSCHQHTHHRENANERLDEMVEEFENVANGRENAFDDEPSYIGVESAH